MELDKTFGNCTQSSGSGCWGGGLGGAFLNTHCFYTKHPCLNGQYKDLMGEQ